MSRPTQAKPPDVPRHVACARLPLLLEPQKAAQELLPKLPRWSLARHPWQKERALARQLVFLHTDEFAQPVAEQTTHRPPPVLLKQHQVRVVQLLLKELPPRWPRVVPEVCRTREDVDVGVLQPKNVGRVKQPLEEPAAHVAQATPPLAARLPLLRAVTARVWLLQCGAFRHRELQEGVTTENGTTTVRVRTSRRK